MTNDRLKKPYQDVPTERMRAVATQLVKNHPLRYCVVDIVLNSWQNILNGNITSKSSSFKIKQTNVSTNVTEKLIRTVLPENISRYVKGFRAGKQNEHDIVCEVDEFYSVKLLASFEKMLAIKIKDAKNNVDEIKTGFYLSVNFENINSNNPKILRIRFGYLDKTDFVLTRNGDEIKAVLTSEAGLYKLIDIYRNI